MSGRGEIKKSTTVKFSINYTHFFTIFLEIFSGLSIINNEVTNATFVEKKMKSSHKSDVLKMRGEC